MSIVPISPYVASSSVSDTFSILFLGLGAGYTAAELGRAGVRMQRIVCRSRYSDGKSHPWLTRRKRVGAGEASSGLGHDLAVEARR
jgi:hypothetical protein